MSYGPDMGEVYDRAADLADRTLRGARPADLPFEQPTRFRLVINKKTLETLGLTIPAAMLMRADEASIKTRRFSVLLASCSQYQYQLH